MVGMYGKHIREIKVESNVSKFAYPARTKEGNMMF